MKKKFETNHIEQYFQVTNNIAPIISEEKVHQIINSPAAKARLKGKPKNILKFTIMTTIFAAIVSAVLWWPGHETQDTRLKTHDNREAYVQATVPKAEVSVYQFKVGKEKQSNTEFKMVDAEKDNTNNNFLAMANPIESSSWIGNEQPNTPNSNIDKSAQPTQQVVQQTTCFDPNTIEPTDGSRFILKLSNDELRKIGIRFFDNTMVYKNTINGYCYKFGSVHHKAIVKDIKGDRTFLKDEMGRYYMDFFEGITFKRINLMDNRDPINDNSQAFVVNGSTDDYSYYYESKEDTISPTSFDFYPVYKTNKFFGDIVGNGTLSRSDFEMANDTLVPILFPKINGSAISEKIFWFVMTDKLYEILSVTQKPLIDELVKYINFKRVNLKKDIITYSSPFLLDKSKVLQLSKNELGRLGFNFYADSTVYFGSNSGFQYKLMLSARRSTSDIRQNDEQKNPELNKGCLAVLTTDSLGIPLDNSLGFLSILFPNEADVLKQIPLLIPVEVKNAGFYKSLIFWFLPNENFYKAIAKDVSDEIKAEYNYVVAEDKSTLVKPECKYFDECRNTLKVSSFKVYPNPASDNATVSFYLPETVNGRITLVDLAGRERQVLKPQTSYGKGQHNIQIDLSNVPEGIYLLTLFTNKGVQTQRIIVNKQ